jgi:hypothetical protein
MADTIDVLLQFIEENWTQTRQHETQRATISNLIVIIAAAISGVVTQTGFNINSLPLALILIALGIYGAVASAKLYERSQYHNNRANHLRARLNELCPDAEIEQLKTIADKEHKDHYPMLATRISLHNVWLLLHIFIALLGIAFTIIIIFKFWS